MRRPFSQILIVLTLASLVRADDVLYRYEGDVLPYDPSAGWLNRLCEYPCSESLEDGHFVLRWPEAGGRVHYFYWIALSDEKPPPSLWVEWRFRSNHPIPPHSYTCDAIFSVRYDQMGESVFIYGDAVISFSGSEFVWGLPNGEFRTYRFESPDGVNFWFSVDGFVFRRSYGVRDGASYLAFAGGGAASTIRFRTWSTSGISCASAPWALVNA